MTMNKGYKLTKIVVETYDKNGERKSKTVKNNSTITLGKYPYFNESGEVDGNYYYMNTSIEASTQIRIYYTDKYTKSEDSGNYYMYRLQIPAGGNGVFDPRGNQRKTYGQFTAKRVR